ncbi:MAG: hypothetical protein F6K31_42585 [Symploca sp. SIO2G7]|nr:hypothetical protein [Symploca sp. SIO2G7]
MVAQHSPTNADLKQFAYVISHDLQEPSRAMTMFAQLLAGDYGQQLDLTALDDMIDIVEGGVRMGEPGWADYLIWP